MSDVHQRMAEQYRVAKGKIERGEKPYDALNTDDRRAMALAMEMAAQAEDRSHKASVESKVQSLPPKPSVRLFQDSWSGNLRWATKAPKSRVIVDSDGFGEDWEWFEVDPETLERK
jgi:hypothetical protein